MEPTLGGTVPAPKKPGSLGGWGRQPGYFNPSLTFRAHQQLRIGFLQAQPLFGVELRLPFEKFVWRLIPAQNIIASVVENEITIVTDNRENRMAVASFIEQNSDQ